MAASSEEVKETARLETFSDGVFAIAITLLILEIRAPALEEGAAPGALWPALLRLWPALLRLWPSCLAAFVSVPLSVAINAGLAIFYAFTGSGRDAAIGN
jgi:uncharacterized membrane protein